MLPIAAYESDSDSEQEQHKESSLPALPSFFSPSSAPKDDPAKHQGRFRTTPHKVNSWATHVYVESPLNEYLDRIIESVTKFSPDIHSLTHDGQAHISLSKCVFLKEHQLDNFADAVRKALPDKHSSFIVSFAQLSVLTNEEQTRSFVTAEIGAGYNELSALVECIDSVMLKFNQPVFYKPPRFHASIAWSLTPLPLEQSLETVPADYVDELVQLTQPVTSLVIKMGNRSTKIPFR
ncbi:hypothetical protein VTP01DRAFT_3973 [Rhizomucor pusillus]|uniref:uncharacterized protein n=1 Tax=Rhizomucor pusillus TaxID=4840 RepID=UPI0037429CFE